MSEKSVPVYSLKKLLSKNSMENTIFGVNTVKNNHNGYKALFYFP